MWGGQGIGMGFQEKVKQILYISYFIGFSFKMNLLYTCITVIFTQL